MLKVKETTLGRFGSRDQELTKGQELTSTFPGSRPRLCTMSERSRATSPR